ncbi:hypothetical protein QYM36_016342 [Artemia franciscana]|uniref:Uncharacterized protein n=1 Tax=Artemia franciscana TaxID=6661 RepID=A0AA88H9P0_ARTSF|nr:hypothetical protein QYM36_016342 [Artemia franciscana]
MVSRQDVTGGAMTYPVEAWFENYTEDYLQGLVVRDDREFLAVEILVEMYTAEKDSIKFLLYLRVVLLGGV